MKKVSLLLVPLALAGCATSPSGLGQAAIELEQANIEMVIESDRGAHAFATCVAEALFGANHLRNAEGDQYWVFFSNAYGVPVARWDFRPRPEGGSRAEFRTMVSAAAGEDKVRACA